MAFPGAHSPFEVVAQTPVVEPKTRPESNPLDEETPQISDGENSDATHRVILYNDEWHGIDEVIFQVQKATGCDVYKAMAITVEAHEKGRAVCYRGDRARCHKAASVLREIRLQVEVDCD